MLAPSWSRCVKSFASMWGFMGGFVISDVEGFICCAQREAAEAFKGVIVA